MEQEQELQQETIAEETEAVENDQIESQQADEQQKKSQEDLLKETLQTKENESAELLDRLQRTMAEFDNFRKRTEKEKATMYQNGAKDTVEKILPVIDNLERALAAEDTQKETQGLLQGIEMVYKQFKEILVSLGVQEINAVGEPFDPNIHNAVTHIEDENYGENEVVEEFQKGYMYNDKVIRYSMVKVAN